MLILSLIFVMLPPPTDSLEATLSIHSLDSSRPRVEWILFDDSANVLTENGSTPTQLQRFLSVRTETVCAKQATAMLGVTLAIPDRGIELHGTARCFRFGIVEGQVRLDGVVAPSSAVP